MRTPSLAFILLLLATGGCRRPSDAPAATTAPSPQTPFSYDKQVGVASGGHTSTDIGCLAIFNESLAPGTTVVLADQPPPHETFDKPTVRQATLVERVAKECDTHLAASSEAGQSASYYRIRARDGEWKGSGVQFAIVDPKHTLGVQEGKIAGDIDGDGAPEFFRICFSSEGAHYQVWTGSPPEGHGRWHWYVYAGYDLESDCTEQDYLGPK